MPAGERAPCVSLQFENLPKDQVFGVQWKTESDSLGFRSGNLKTETRRWILSFVASAYNPLGLVALVVLPAKCMLQELCRKNHGWYKTLPRKMSKKVAIMAE